MARHRETTPRVPETRPAKLAPRKPTGNYRSYAVRNGESFVTIAKRFQLDPWDLIHFNFRTYDTKEVNWYLREYVGCKVPTRNGKSWHFSNSASPGIIHIPLPGPTREQRRCMRLGLLDRAFLFGRRNVLRQEIRSIRKHIHNVQQYAADDGDYTIRSEVTRTKAILKAVTTILETLPIGAPSAVDVKTELRTQSYRLSEYARMIKNDNDRLEKAVRELVKIEALMKQCDRLETRAVVAE